MAVLHTQWIVGIFNQLMIREPLTTLTALFWMVISVQLELIQSCQTHPLRQSRNLKHTNKNILIYCVPGATRYGKNLFSKRNSWYQNPWIKRETSLLSQINTISADSWEILVTQLSTLDGFLNCRLLIMRYSKYKANSRGRTWTLFFSAHLLHWVYAGKERIPTMNCSLAAIMFPLMAGVSCICLVFFSWA